MSDGDSVNIRACKANCHTCAFKYDVGKKKIPYCSLGRYPILNPDIGCHKRMHSSEFEGVTKPNKYISQEEIDAAKEAGNMKHFNI